MTSQLLDYPTELAERAYAHSLVPDKAAKERSAFDEHMEELRRELAEFAQTERQQHLLDQLMHSYRNTYIAELKGVLEAKLKYPEFNPTGKRLSPYGEAVLAMRQWKTRARRDMEFDIRAVEQPDARWTKRVAQEAESVGRVA